LVPEEHGSTGVLDVCSPAFHEMPFRISFKGPQETVRQQKKVSKTGEKSNIPS